MGDQGAARPPRRRPRERIDGKPRSGRLTGVMWAGTNGASGASAGSGEVWLGGRDSNPDNVVQSHVSYR